MSAEAWSAVGLGDVIELHYGRALPSESRTGTGFPVFGSSGAVGFHADALVGGPGIVVGRKGTVGAIEWAAGPFWPIDTTYFVVPRQPVDLRWLYWQLATLGLSRLDSSTGVPGLNRDDAYALTLRLPSLLEQRRIAEILDTLDEAIRGTERVIAKLQQMKQGLLHDLLTRGIDENGELRDPERHPEQFKDSPLGRIPVAWEVAPIDGMLSRVIDYRGRTPTKTDSGIPLLTAKNVRDGYVDSEPREFISPGAFDSWMTRGVPSPGDVLFTTEAPVSIPRQSRGL